MSRLTEMNATLTLPAAQAGDTTNLTEQDAIPIPLGALARIATITEAATKKQMELKRKTIQIAMIPEFAAFRK